MTPSAFKVIQQKQDIMERADHYITKHFQRGVISAKQEDQQCQDGSMIGLVMTDNQQSHGQSIVNIMKRKH